jgi:hypothetical protein
LIFGDPDPPSPTLSFPRKLNKGSVLTFTEREADRNRIFEYRTIRNNKPLSTVSGSNSHDDLAWVKASANLFN